MDVRDSRTANEVLIAQARELIAAYSSPPLCRVCGEALTCGSASGEGIKWAHYDAPRNRDLLFDKDYHEHVDKSTRWDPIPDPVIVAVARGFLEKVRVLRDRDELYCRARSSRS